MMILFRRGEIIIKSKSFLIVSVLVSVLLVSTIVTAGAQDLSVAVVKTQDIFRAHPAFQEVQQKLRQKQNEMRTELQELSEEKAKERQKEMQQELQKLQQDLVKKAVETVKKDVGSIATDMGYDVVINKGGIIDGKDELGAEDITEEVLSEMKEN